MEREKKIRLLRMIGAAVLYVWAAAACWGAEKSESQVYLALERGVMSQTAAEIRAQTEDPIGCCFWGEEEEQTVSSPVTGRTAQAARVYLEGNAELLGAGALAWQDGCLIDEKTAQALFGTVSCGAQRLSWEGQSYPVLGTVPALRPTVVMTAREEDRMDRCVLALPAENGKILGEGFLLRFGLRGKVLDFFPLWALVRNCLLLAPGVILFSLCRRLGWDRKKPGRTALVFALGVCGAVLLWKGLVIPPELIPSRWSDFSFWSRMWEAQKENLRCILFTPLGGRQLQILLNMVKSMGGSILAALLVRKAHRPMQ